MMNAARRRETAGGQIVVADVRLLEIEKGLPVLEESDLACQVGLACACAPDEESSFVVIPENKNTKRLE